MGASCTEGMEQQTDGGWGTRGARRVLVSIALLGSATVAAVTEMRGLCVPTPTRTRMVMQTMGRTQGSMLMNLAASSSGASDALCPEPCSAT